MVIFKQFYKIKTNFMAKKNSEKKKEIEGIIEKFMEQMTALRKRRDIIISNFISLLEKKKMEEIKKQFE